MPLTPGIPQRGNPRGHERVPAGGLREAARVPGAAADVEEHLVALLSPHSFEADRYRALRHFLKQVHGSTGLSVLGVTSPVAGDGKTTTAINLAASLAQSPGVRVLLIDADLRRPRVALNLGLGPSGPGLSGALANPETELAAAVRKLPFGFSVLPSGPLPPNAYQTLESLRLTQLLDQARHSYDYVILDTPPVLLVPDCALISGSVDGFLIVVGAHRTPRKLLGETLSAMDPGKVVGIVVNGDDDARTGYYKRYGGSYYREPIARPARRGGWLRWPSR
jgi:capsular exopolysaccharide synthesis family protein